MRGNAVLVAREYRTDACVAASVVESIVKTHAAGLREQSGSLKLEFGSKWFKNVLISAYLLVQVCECSAR
jgi:hypothetical protein